MKYFPKALTLLIPLLIAGLAIAAPSPEDQLDDLKKDIRRERMRVDRAERLEKGILSAVRAYNASIAGIRREITKLNADLKKTDEDITASEAKREELKKLIDAQRVRLSARLRAMYKFGAPGLAELILSAGSYSDLDRRHKYFEELAKLDQSLLDSYRANTLQLESLEVQLKDKRVELHAVRKQKASQQVRLLEEREGKKELLRDIQEHKELHMKALAELEAASRRLNGLIARVDKPKPRPPPPPEPVERDPGTPDEPVEKREPVENILQPPVSEERGFELARGKMCMPARGSIIKTYGTKVNPRFKTRTFHKGINIGANSGSRIRAIYNGEVVYAGWLKGYGNLIILKHEGSYYTLYAHVQKIYKAKGAIVKTGQTIGTVGETGSLEGPSLYFEIRHHEKPLNPSKWLNRSCG